MINRDNKSNPLNAKPKPKPLTPEEEEELTDLAIIMNQIQNG